MTLNGAAFPPRQSDDTNGTRPSEDSEHQHQVERTTGRGGAGNFGIIDSDQEEDYSVPPIKTPVYTSGRGGTGNMQQNDFEHPEYARAAQDVEMIPRQGGSASEYHGGRHGAGNVFYDRHDDDEEEYLDNDEYNRRVKYDKTVAVDHTRHDYRGWADKGKAFLFRRSHKK